MSKIMETVKEIVQAAAVALDPPPESFAVVDEYGNEWSYVRERTCHHVDDGIEWVDEEFCCSECGCTTSLTMSSLSVISDGELNYCPNCGAKVVVEE